MPKELMSAFIGAVASLLIVILTKISDVCISQIKKKQDTKQKNYQIKRDNLTEVYKILISILNLFPEKSPNTIMKYIKYAPSYDMEHFDAVIISLDYQKEDLQKQLNLPQLTYQRKNDVETKISNIEYSRKRIIETKEKYFKAKEKYTAFCKEDKTIFDLYAGIEVQKCLVHFEVVIHNVFISGLVFENSGDSVNNVVAVSKRNLINAMRYDIGMV